MSDLTQVLNRVQQGDAHAAEELLPLLYDELRRVAAAKLAREAPGQTLQPTALVHEAWLRLGGQQSSWRNRAHFFGAAAEAMRRILIDRARRRRTLRHGAEAVHEELFEEALITQAPDSEMLAIDEALDALAAIDSTAAEIVKLRYFVGLTVDETADALQIAPRTVHRSWAFARAWLKERIAPSGAAP